MSRSDLLIKLVEAGSQNDQRMLERTVAALVAEARAKQHNTLADRLSSVMGQSQDRAPRTIGGSMLPDKVRDLIVERPAGRPLSSIQLSADVRSLLAEFLDEQQQGDLLRAHSLEPRSKLMLVGPPGNGKTSVAEAIAYELSLPFLMVRYEGIVGSYLGETSSRLKRVFDFARTTPCVLFLDEFDAIGKERGDRHETGEIKRVVSSLLMQMDELPPYVVLICATNHPELLDRAVWRRFQLRLELKNPAAAQIREWVRPFAKELGTSPDKLAKVLNGASFAEIEEFMLAVRRRRILLRSSLSDSDVVAREIRGWQQRYRAKAGGELDGDEELDSAVEPARDGKPHSRRRGPKSAAEGQP